MKKKRKMIIVLAIVILLLVLIMSCNKKEKFFFKNLQRKMVSRKYNSETIKAYIHYNKALLKYTDKQPEKITERNIKDYLFYLIEGNKVSTSTLNSAINALKFYYNVVLKRKFFYEIKGPYKGKKLPAVLSKEELEKFLSITDNNYTYNIDQFAIDWGNKLLKKLNVLELNNHEKAVYINEYIHDNIKFCGFRAKNIKEIIENKKGNCFCHARLGIFLLRLAGIPAKFAYEIHIRKCTMLRKIKGKNKKTGLYGCAHNDHIWVFFYDNGIWIPFDSSLGIIGINEFITKRWDNKFLMGPPFVIYEDSGNGLVKMENITIEFWNNKPKDSFNIIDFNTWYEFLNSFSEMEIKDFDKPLNKSLLLKISKISKLWYN